MHNDNKENEKENPTSKNSKSDQKTLFYEIINKRSLIKFKLINTFYCKFCQCYEKLEFVFNKLIPKCSICFMNLKLKTRNFNNKIISIDSENKFDNIEDKFIKYFVLCLIWEIRHDALTYLNKNIIENEIKEYLKNYEDNDNFIFHKLNYYEEIKNRITESNDFNLFLAANENLSNLEINDLFYYNFKNLFENNILFKYSFLKINWIKLQNEKFSINYEIDLENENKNIINNYNYNKINTSNELKMKKEYKNKTKNQKNYKDSTFNNVDYKDLIDDCDLFIHDANLNDMIDESFDEELKNPTINKENKNNFSEEYNVNNNSELTEMNDSLTNNLNYSEIKGKLENQQNFLEQNKITVIQNFDLKENILNLNEKINKSNSNELIEKSYYEDTSEINNHKNFSSMKKLIKEKVTTHKIKKNIIKNYHKDNNWEKINDDYTLSRKKFLTFLNTTLFSNEEKNYLIYLDENQYHNKLRIYAFKYEIINSIINNSITIVVSEPGSGKTTQIVQYCLNINNQTFSNKKPVWCTQPRKISCVSVSERVSEEIEDENFSLVKTLISNIYTINKNNLKKFHKKKEEENFSDNFQDYYPNFKKNYESKINNIDETTKIIFSTENVLLNELIEDPYLYKVDILIIDEAHERSLNLDIILYFIKTYTLKIRKDFRLIITSATLNYKQFYGYFKTFNYNIINQIEKDFILFYDNIKFSPDSEEYKKNQKSLEKKYSVLVEFSNEEINAINYQNKTLSFLKNLLENVFKNIQKNNKNNKNKKVNYLKNKINNNFEIPENITDKNFLTILVFLPDTKSILYLKNNLTYFFQDSIEIESLFIFQLYGSMTFSEQNEVISFFNENSVKLILSTNIAETSVTIQYCNIVVDTGLQKIRRYSYTSKLLEDNIELISKDSAFQRQGRCGRINDGICYKLYTRNQLEQMNDYRIAEVSRVNISYMILKLIYFGICNVFNVRLIEQPSNEDILYCLNDLLNLQAIIKENIPENLDKSVEYNNSLDNNNFFEDEYYKVTEFGNWLYKIELEPTIGRVLYDGITEFKFGLNEILMITSSATVGDNLIYYKKRDYIQLPYFLDVNCFDIFEYENNNNYNNKIEYNKKNQIILDNKDFNPETIMKEKLDKYINSFTENIFSDIILSYGVETDENFLEFEKKNEENSEIKKIEQESLKIYMNTNSYLNNLHKLTKYFEIYKILNNYFNPNTYFEENHISSLGDIMINLFCVRQFQKTSCFFHYNLIINSGNFFKTYCDDIPSKNENYRGCKYCINSKYGYINRYSLNVKSLKMQISNYKNLKKILEIYYNCGKLINIGFNIYGFGSKCSELEYKLIYWNSIYNLLFLENFEKIFLYNKLDVNYLLEKLREINFKDILMDLYLEYKKFYIDIIGPCFFRVFSYNISLKPNINFYENKKRKRLNLTHELNDNYIMINTETRCKIYQNSFYRKYFSFLDWKKENNLYIGNKDLDEFNFMVFSLQVINLNETNLKNVNPIYPSMLKYYSLKILNEIKRFYLTKSLNIFSISDIGQYFINYLLEKKKNLEKSTYNDLISSNPLMKIINCSMSNNKNSIYFLTENSTFKQDQAMIINYIETEKKNLKENVIEEIGYLNRDCLILKMGHGFRIINIEYNKDPIHFKIIFNQEFFTMKNLEKLLNSKNYKYNKLYFYRDNFYISFKNSNESNNFQKSIRLDFELAEKFTLMLIEEDLIYSNSNSYQKNSILSVLVDRDISSEKVKEKINKFGNIKDIIIKNIDNYLDIKFIMSSETETNNILTKFKAHEDNLGKWSSVKLINRNFDIYIDNKFIFNNPEFWEEFNQFTEENKIYYVRKNRNKIFIREFSDFNIRKILSFISEDVIHLCNFSLMEIKLNCCHSFYKRINMEFSQFCTKHKVYIELFHYMKKLHIFGTPQKREIVKNIINNYLDELSNDLKFQIIQVNDILNKYSILKTKKNNELKMFNQIKSFKKNIMISVNLIRKKYVKQKVYLEINYNMQKNIIEIKARTKDFDDINSYLNQIFENLIIQIIESYSLYDTTKNGDLLHLEHYRDSKDNIYCQICLETVNEKNLVKLSFCGDIYCRECIKNLILMQINAQPKADLPIKCSICDDIILNSDIFRLFKQNELKFLFYQVTKYFMATKNKNNEYSWCENPSCQFVYRNSQYREINTNLRNCPNCLKAFCLLCSSELKDNVHNQECKVLIMKNLDKDIRKWVIKNTNNCPICNEIYEKSLGCNHMVCKKCLPEIHFCYICGEILDSKNPYTHFNNEIDFPNCFQNLHNDVERIDPNKNKLDNLNYSTLKSDKINDSKLENNFKKDSKSDEKLIIEDKNKFKNSLLINNLNDTRYLIKEHEEFFNENYIDNNIKDLLNSNNKNQNIFDNSSPLKTFYKDNEINSKSNYININNSNKSKNLIYLEDNNNDEKYIELNKFSSSDESEKIYISKSKNKRNTEIILKVEKKVEKINNENKKDIKKFNENKNENMIKLENPKENKKNYENIKNTYKKENKSNNYEYEEFFLNSNKKNVKKQTNDSSIENESDGDDINFFFQNKNKSESSSEESENKNHINLTKLKNQKKNKNLNDAVLILESSDSSSDIESYFFNKKKTTKPKREKIIQKDDNQFQDFFINSNNVSKNSKIIKRKNESINNQLIVNQIKTKNVDDYDKSDFFINSKKNKKF